MNPPPDPRRRTERLLAAGLSVLLLAVVASPVFQNGRDKPHDSFPLSYYPMFSHKRDAHYKVTYLVGLNADGHRRAISYKLAGTGGFNQVRRQIRRAAREGRAEALCADVATRLAQHSAFADLRQVAVLTGTFALDGYFQGRQTPVREKTHATCTLPWISS